MNNYLLIYLYVTKELKTKKPIKSRKNDAKNKETWGKKSKTKKHTKKNVTLMYKTTCLAIKFS